MVTMKRMLMLLFVIKLGGGSDTVVDVARLEDRFYNNVAFLVS